MIRRLRMPYTSSVIMRGLLGRRVPLLRRLVTLIPALWCGPEGWMPTTRWWSPR